MYVQFDETKKYFLKYKSGIRPNFLSLNSLRLEFIYLFIYLLRFV